MKVSARRAASQLSSSTLAILGLVMLVNALSYATIIPLLYPYASRFGFNAVGLSILFASFSLAQFIATPIIGRLSDRYGRKPALLWSLLGTSLSLALFALAQNAFMLIVARVLDGITGGNISVAQAIISDKATGNDRAKAFGIIGASFGFGFLFGPALGGFLSQFGLTAPFWFASALAFVGTLLGWALLPETLPKGAQREQKRESLFNFKHLVSSLFSPLVGVIFVLTFFGAVAQNAWLIGFQTSTVDILRLSPTEVGILFTLSGVVNILMQAIGVRWLLNRFPHKRHILIVSVAVSVLTLSLAGLAHSLWAFALVIVAHMVIFAPQNPLITALLTERAENEDQGALLGVNQSYLSLGQIVGPLIAGAVAQYSVPLIFVVAGGVQILSLAAVIQLYQPHQKKFDL